MVRRRRTCTPESDDFRPAFECIQHDRDSAVFVEMRDRLIAAPGEIVVPEGFVVEDAEVRPVHA